MKIKKNRNRCINVYYINLNLNIVIENEIKSINVRIKNSESG